MTRKRKPRVPAPREPRKPPKLALIEARHADVDPLDELPLIEIVLEVPDGD